jgi:hypothetical protein
VIAGEAEVGIEAVATMLPVEDMASAVEAWAALLGAAPTFVDGERWAQFDVAGRRIALAGTDRVSDHPGVMIKVGDLEAARARAIAQGLGVGPLREGPHETRFVVESPGGWPVVFYAPRAG